MSKRPFVDRLLDRIWTDAGRWLQDETPPASATTPEGNGSSVSCTMQWPLACEALASGTWTSAGFRRRRAVREVVETLGPSDGKHLAAWLSSVRPELLEDKRVRQANGWGNPIQAPGWVLGTRDPWSPTSLRYLAHALWLEEAGFTQPGGTVIEIGVGFGGLAAMLAVVSNVKTMLVDLPEVERAAALQMRELGLVNWLAPNSPRKDDFCFVSNYAFTELNRSLQDHYIETYARHARRGVIVSNARMFSAGIGGRNNAQLVDALRLAGLAAEIVTTAPVLGPSDALCGNCLICWRPSAEEAPRREQGDAR